MISQSISGEMKHVQDVSLVVLITIVDGISEGVCWQSSLNMAQRGTVQSIPFVNCQLFKQIDRYVVML